MWRRALTAFLLLALPFAVHCGGVVGPYYKPPAPVSSASSSPSSSLSVQPSAFEVYIQSRWLHESNLPENRERFANLNLDSQKFAEHLHRRKLESLTNWHTSETDESNHRETFGARPKPRNLLTTKGGHVAQRMFSRAMIANRRVLQNSGGGAGGANSTGVNSTVVPIQAPELASAPSRGDMNLTWYRWQSVFEPPVVDWTVSPYMTTVLNQMMCESCWAMTTTDLVSVAWAQVNNQSGESLSTQHACDCGTGRCCSGGWPEWVLHFIVSNGGVASNAEYPYQGNRNSNNTCVNVAKAKLKAKVTGWEKTPPRSTSALLKAVAQHPVLVYIAAGSEDFANYVGGVFTGECNGEIDHAVLVVGYNMVDPLQPYWLIKNTWGSGWGENGYMRLPMLVDGPGYCSIQSERGLYPIFYERGRATACHMVPSPCGGGSCVVRNNAARCACPAGFVERLEDDAPKCVTAMPCNANPNPCGIGACSNEFDGSYTCKCPPGAVIGSQVDGSITCALGTFQSGLPTYTVMQSDTCQSISSTWNVTLEFLQLQNPFLDCSINLTQGFVLLLSASSQSSGCSAADIVGPNDTCASVAARNNITVRQLSGINPAINCSSYSDPATGATAPAPLLLSQLLCVSPGVLSVTSPLIRSCGRVYNVGPGDRCVDISRGFGLSLSEFMWLNPGLKCGDYPIDNAISVCVSALSTEFLTVSCTKWYTVTQGDTCPLIANAAGLQVRQFLRLNPGLRCYVPYFQIGQAVCVNGTVTATTSFSISPLAIPYSVEENDTLASISKRHNALCPNNTFPRSICSMNSLPDCSDQSITPNQMLLIPCQRKIANDWCTDDIPVCGIDGVTYSSACNALLSYATPTTPGSCALCNNAICKDRMGQRPVANSCPAKPLPCPYPPWPLPPDYFNYCPWMFPTNCECIMKTCDYLCRRSASTYKYNVFDKYATFSTPELFRQACNNTCFGNLRTGCGV